MKERKYHHGDLRNALVAEGLRLLEEEGLSGISLRAIAKRAGVSHTAPKNHFGSVKGLMTAIATEGFRRHAAFMREGLTDAATREDRLRAAMTGYVRFAEAHPHLFRLMFSPLYCDLRDAELQRVASESYAILAEISEGLDWAKADAPGGQRRTEMMLWSLVHGYSMLELGGQFLTDDEGRPIHSIEEIMPAFGYRAR